MRTFAACLLWLCAPILGASPPAATFGDIQAGQDSALVGLRQRAAGGDTDAQTALAKHYFQRGDDQGLALAAHWYRSAISDRPGARARFEWEWGALPADRRRDMLGRRLGIIAAENIDSRRADSPSRPSGFRLPWTMTLPDLRRGLVSLERGNSAAAESDLRPLAEQGYVQAQIALGDLYAQRGGVDRIKAVKWYRRALSKDASARIPLLRALLAMPGQARSGEIASLIRAADADDDRRNQRRLLRLYRDFPELVPTAVAAAMAERFAASEFSRDRLEAIRWYRARGDDQVVYADRLATLCERDLALFPACYADLVRHRRLQGDLAAALEFAHRAQALYQAGRMTPHDLERAAVYLAENDLPGRADPVTAYALLKGIDPPSPMTRVQMAKLLILDPSLEPGVKADSLLRIALQAGELEAALVLGRRHLDADYADADPDAAEALLRRAAQSIPAAHYYLGRLYERGYSGRPDPAQALAHYLQAARQGYTRADLALARMFWRDRGILVDPVNAYAFALIASGNQVAGAAELMAQMGLRLQPEDIRAARSLAVKELAARHRSLAPARAAAMSSSRMPDGGRLGP